MPAYLMMSYLNKRSNRIWVFLIRHRLTAKVWRLLIEISRWWHVRFGAALAARTAPRGTGTVVSASV